MRPGLEVVKPGIKGIRAQEDHNKADIVSNGQLCQSRNLKESLRSSRATFLTGQIQNSLINVSQQLRRLLNMLVAAKSMLATCN